MAAAVTFHAKTFFLFITHAEGRSFETKQNNHGEVILSVYVADSVAFERFSEYIVVSLTLKGAFGLNFRNLIDPTS